MTALIVIALAACMFGPVLAGRVQILIAPAPREPLPKYYGGTDSPDDFAAALKDDAREWAAILREKVMAGTAARPGATVVQFPGVTS